MYDPQAMTKAQAILPPSDRLEYLSKMDAVPEGCDALVLATEWPEFGKLDFVRTRKIMATPIIFDGRNLLDRAEVEAHGFIYKGVGR